VHCNLSGFCSPQLASILKTFSWPLWWLWMTMSSLRWMIWSRIDTSRDGWITRCPCFIWKLLNRKLFVVILHIRKKIVCKQMVSAFKYFLLWRRSGIWMVVCLFGYLQEFLFLFKFNWLLNFDKFFKPLQKIEYWWLRRVKKSFSKARRSKATSANFEANLNISMKAFLVRSKFPLNCAKISLKNIAQHCKSL
jgi:hypothetical protein